MAAGMVAGSLLPSFCQAAEGLYLSWGDCRQSTDASPSAASACNSDVGMQSLYAAFTLDAPIDSVVAVEVAIDLQNDQPGLPAWWQYAPGECRFGALTATGDFRSLTACGDIWNGDASVISPPPYFATRPHGGAAQAEIVVTIGVPSTQFRPLSSTTTMYYAARLDFHNERTTQCAGCMTGTCLVLNAVRVGRLRGDGSLEIIPIHTPAMGNANWATWQGGSNCAAVPVRNITWGRVKNLYSGT